MTSELKRSSDEKTTNELTAIKEELAAIGSTYIGGIVGWKHEDESQGKTLVRRLVRINRAIAATREKAPGTWGEKGEPGTVICPSCGKRGQDRYTVCDHCGYAIRD